MFSEYASRFLAQSQSRLSVHGNAQHDGSPSRRSSDRQRSAGSRLASRSYLQRPNMPNPYHHSVAQLARLPFASRSTAAQAPLFFSATEEFRDEDDGEEHQREITDFYSLQKSRRGDTRLIESSEGSEGADVSTAGDRSYHDEEEPKGNGKGIRSSWKGEPSEHPERRGRSLRVSPRLERVEREVSGSQGRTDASRASRRLVDIDLASNNSFRSSIDAVQRSELDAESEVQTLENLLPPTGGISRVPQEHAWIPEETPSEAAQLHPRPLSPERETVPDAESLEQVVERNTLRHDAFWSTLYFICLAALFASAFLVYLHTSTPSGKTPLGDTIYTTLRSSFHLLAVDTLVAAIVASLWLALLRNFLRPLTYLIIFAVPIILFSFSLWPLVTSFHGVWLGSSVQDKIMRVFSIVPFLGAISWSFMAVRARVSLDRAIDILTFATKILASSPALVLAGFVTLAVTILWFWLWIAMFSRIFLNGHMVKKFFIIDPSAWGLGVFFAVMLLWTQAVIAGMQRAVSAATVSQWYFHRNSASPAPSSLAIASAALDHAANTLFGTICLSGLARLTVHLPLLILPARLASFLSLCVSSIVPGPIAYLTNPLSLTYAAIHGQPLASSAFSVSRLPLTTSIPGGAAHHHHYSARARRAVSPLAAHSTAHLILHATRWITTLALGLSAWIRTARAGSGSSLYAYVVGLGAAAVASGVLGAVEGIVAGVVDGLLVCWASEVVARSADAWPRREYCAEAGKVFGGGVRRDEEV